MSAFYSPLLFAKFVTRQKNSPHHIYLTLSDAYFPAAMPWAVPHRWHMGASKNAEFL
jgi:hypothetical protein